MIKIYNRYGTIEISDTFLANLLGNAVSSCFGVVGMAVSGPSQGLRTAINKGDTLDKGVKVRSSDGKLIIDLHIIVTFGVNIEAIVNSIINKASYTVHESTGLIVDKVNVFVDGMEA